MASLPCQVLRQIVCVHCVWEVFIKTYRTYYCYVIWYCNITVLIIQIFPYCKTTNPCTKHVAVVIKRLIILIFYRLHMNAKRCAIHAFQRECSPMLLYMKFRFTITHNNWNPFICPLKTKCYNESVQKSTFQTMSLLYRNTLWYNNDWYIRAVGMDFAGNCIHTPVTLACLMSINRKKLKMREKYWQWKMVNNSL